MHLEKLNGPEPICLHAYDDLRAVHYEHPQSESTDLVKARPDPFGIRVP